MDILGSIKALHIIFVVNWFAGLFYIVRLFIYYVEAQEKEEIEKNILQTQYKLMQKRLWYIITWPSAVIVICSGLYLAF
ncbi:MAG: CopD family protein, partial [Flavobacteriales bacterium]|nr:CopD family protein [Flavobacteriales bacterium]